MAASPPAPSRDMQFHTLPLAKLHRAGRTLSLLSGQVTAAAARPTRRDAETQLEYWRGDVHAIRELRHALHRLEPTMPVFAMQDDQVLRTLGEAMFRGIITLDDGSGSLPAIRSIRPLEPAPEVNATPAGMTPSPASATNAVMPPAAVSMLPLLPVLEQVRMKSAEVLPEVEQSLDQIALSLERLGSLGISLERTPSAIPAIREAMSDAAASIATALEAL